MIESKPTREEMLEFIDSEISRHKRQAVFFRLDSRKFKPIKRKIEILDTIRRLIEQGRPSVSKKQIAAWTDRLQSEVDIVGYVPEWLVKDILEYAGVEARKEGPANA